MTGVRTDQLDAHAPPTSTRTDHAAERSVVTAARTDQVDGHDADTPLIAATFHVELDCAMTRARTCHVEPTALATAPRTAHEDPRLPATCCRTAHS